MNLPDYTDVEHMIFRGFLTDPAEIAGVPVVFKTINQIEYEIAILYSQSSDPDEATLLRECYFIAASVYLFNRNSVLQDRDLFYQEFVDIIRELPEEVRARLLGHLQGLNSRALDAIYRVEGFSYGMDSRQRWALFQRIPPNDPRVTGIPGTEMLGLNMHQRLWFHFNHLDDQRDSFDRDWSRTKFLASLHSKEINKIDAQDKTRRRDEMRRREALLRGETPDEGVKGVNGEVKVSHESVDDLLGQLKRDIEGQKDFHDQVVEAHEKRIREQWMRREAEKLRRVQEARQEQRDRFSPDVKDPIIFYDEEAVKRLSKENKHRQREALKRGDFATEQERFTHRDRMRKWGILGDEDVASPKKSVKEPKHSLGGTILDDYYDVQVPDMRTSDPFDDE